MKLKEKLLSSYLAFEENIDLENDIHNIRNEAIKFFEHSGFPHKKQEAWKYTSLNSILKEDYSIFPKKEETIEYRDIKKYCVHDIDTYQIVFIDGIYASHLSQTTHDKFDACLMSSALNKAKYKSIIKKYFNKVAPQESLTALNTAFSHEGAYIKIPKDIIAEKPIQILNFSTGNEHALMVQPRNLIIAEDNAQVQIIERHQSLTDNAVLTNSVTEIFAGKNANIDYYKIQNDKITSSLIDNTFISQDRDSEVSMHTFSFGGKLTRNNLNFYQNGSNINSILKGVTIIEGKQHVDHNTLVHHRKPHSESHQDYKGIFAEKSTGVFNGKVLVDKIAQKTDAYQSNNNILIDDQATINSKPQLEIFADDVKCSHGCTVGQLDKEALFYMKTRGIPHKEARALLMFAFANNVLNSVKIPEIKKRITGQIASKIGVQLGFDL
ncbi:Fe-S cluster assembly protein SufD [Flavobacterium sp. CS20]|jgi:Fe-S cluster assembly protein SufD|uniref:Fe-S cluster assembly protein SufD n=1 Tax=Flavobacterium sp. CS20 TaxID=2775246 RepID=UPI001B39FFAD|nr:Fe-S cluster assembly protein SufD [Flavobacterium sp. CS20]QTY26243.1 Fe-S cluster assembly protein SufD [Flavobacterium sp. CS20]